LSNFLLCNEFGPKASLKTVQLTSYW